MEFPAIANRYPNLPVGQRLAQWLADRFNDDEMKWFRDRAAIAARLERMCRENDAAGTGRPRKASHDS